MAETSIITGKIQTKTPSASNSVSKRLYIKILVGTFWHRAPRAKKAKIYGGELLIRYSQKEWPEKKNGPLLGDDGLLNGVGQLLKEVNLVNTQDISYAKVQHPMKETITITVGPALAKEMVERRIAMVTDG